MPSLSPELDFPALALRLQATIDSLPARLAAFDDASAAQPFAPGKWSRKQLLSHLVDSAANNHLRFARAALEGAFEGPGYDQDGCVRLADPDAMPWSELCALFVAYNRYLAHLIAKLPAERASAPCRIGGAEAQPLSAMANDYLRHLKHHVDPAF